ncbi:MAG TPA: hypothetical protein VF626_00035 [Chthoniobacterales bacterium]|jgi:hypothetical protein
MSINVSIERLILEGLPVNHAQGGLVQGAVETELARLLTEQGMNHVSGGAVPSLSSNSIEVARDSKPAQLGQQIAQAIYSSLNPAPVLPRETHSSRASHE